MKPTKHNRYEVSEEWATDSIKSWWARLYVAGDLRTAEMICRQHCFPKGLCVTIEPTKYIFAGGTEDGVCIGFIQYVPFPEDEKEILKRAVLLGKDVAAANFQWSFSIITPIESIYYSRRKK